VRCLATRVQSLVKACDLLKAFRETDEALPLQELASRTGLNKTTACRLLKTLVDAGLISQSGSSGYRLLVRFGASRKRRIGYALQSREFGFSRAIAKGLKEAADAAHLEVVLLDNSDDRRTALRNAEILIRERVDLVIESHADARIAAVISRKFADAGLPVIAVEIPIPQTIYYGANNTQAGLIAGRYLARWASLHWKGEFDEVLLLELPKAGQVPNARVLGSLLGVIEQFTTVANRQVRVLRTDGHVAAAHERVRTYLRKTKAKRILVSAINDPSAIGALEAFREAGREEQCAIVGQNASEEVHEELRNKRSRLIGSVGYFPERYGEGLVPLALEILAGRRVPAATFVKHQLITPANIGAYYPRDSAA
jgi:ribose transport system substrate-binding protein